MELVLIVALLQFLQYEHAYGAASVVLAIVVKKKQGKAILLLVVASFHESDQNKFSPPAVICLAPTSLEGSIKGSSERLECDFCAIRITQTGSARHGQS